MTYSGHVKNGVVVLDDPVILSEGAHVRIEVMHEPSSESLHPEVLRFTGVLPKNIDVKAEYAEGAAEKHT